MRREVTTTTEVSDYSHSMPLRCGPLALPVLQSVEDGKELIADHVAGIASFTARLVTEDDGIQNHRVGIVVTMDGEAIRSGSIHCPHMVHAVISEVVSMLHKMVGSAVMAEVMAIRHQMAMEKMIDDVMGDIGFGCDNSN